MTSEILEQLNSIKTEHSAKKIYQDQEKAKDGKYKQILKTKDDNGVDYSVTEYVCPNGEVGFDIVFYAELDGVEYQKTICYGQEAETRAHDWMEITNE